MAPNGIAGVGGALPSGASPAGKAAKFSQALEAKPGGGQKVPQLEARGPQKPLSEAHRQVTRAVKGPTQVKAPAQVAKPSSVAATQPVAKPPQAAVQLVDRVANAQQRMDQLVALAQSGKTFTPAELLSLQANVYAASQELDLTGKVVEKATGGVKQVLQTQV